MQWFVYDREIDEFRQSHVWLDEKTYPVMYHVPGCPGNVCTRWLAVGLSFTVA